MIKRGVARYNWQTGKWEWGEPYENRDAPKVLEKLATSDKATIVVERLTDGKMRVTSNFWDGGEGDFAQSVARSKQWRRPAARPTQA
jgi:hypothetical protein